MERTSRLETIERGDDRTTDLRYFFHDSAAAVNAEMAAKRKELLEVRPFRDPLVRDTTSFGDDESNINQVAEHLHVEKNIAAFLPSRTRWFLRESVSRVAIVIQTLTSNCFYHLNRTLHSSDSPLLVRTKSGPVL